MCRPHHFAAVEEVDEEMPGIAALERQMLQKRIGEPLAAVKPFQAFQTVFKVLNGPRAADPLAENRSVCY